MITQAELEKIASLAKLSPGEEDAPALLDSMADILNVAASIADVDFSRLDCSGDSEPAVLREDTLTGSVSRMVLLRDAPVEREGYFAAPPVAGQRQ